jgi:hypothetical protein
VETFPHLAKRKKRKRIKKRALEKPQMIFLGKKTTKFIGVSENFVS